MNVKRAWLYYSVMSILLIWGLVSILGCIPSKVSPESEVAETQYRQISVEDYEDKVAGGWLGQATGVLWGQYTEGKWQGEMIPFDLEDWYRTDRAYRRQVLGSIDTTKARETGDWSEYWEKLHEIIDDKAAWEKYTPEQMSNQDDLYLEFMFLHSIQKYGLDVTSKEIAQDWVSYLDSDKIWCANKGAYQNFTKDIWPPMSGHPDNTIWGNAIDYQIEADLFGLISPGLPRSSNAWGDKVGHIMNYGDGVYAGMAMSAMYGEAFFENDPRKLVEYSLLAIPAESEYAEMVRFVIATHDKHPDNWQAAWQEIEDKTKESGWNTKALIGADVRINGAYVYMGLLYGEGDFWKTMNISMRCGRDSDCNPSSAVGILGTAMGLTGTPEKWTILRDKPISNLGSGDAGRTMREIYPDYLNWDDILEATVEVGKQNILANGGKIKDGMIYIPLQTPTVPALEQVPVEEASFYER